MRQAVHRTGGGALFDITSDAVVVLEGTRVTAWNGSAERLFGVPEQEALADGADPLGPHRDTLLALPPDAPKVRVALPPHGTVAALRRQVDDLTVLMLRDVTADVRREEGLRRVAALSRQLLGAQPSVQGVLQSLAAEAKALTGAAFSALLLLREGSTTESSHFVYDAPRHLFPERMPRPVGLLSVPLTTRRPARLDDVRGHAAGVGLPGVHPPLGPLLAVPMVAGDVVLGELAAANPPGGRPFDDIDEALLVDLAAHATAAVSWAQVAERERERALVRQEVVDTARHDIRTPVGAGKGFALLLQRRRDRMSPEQVESALQGLVDAFTRIESFSARLLLDERSAVAGVEPVWTQVEVEPAGARGPARRRGPHRPRRRRRLARPGRPARARRRRRDGAPGAGQPRGQRPAARRLGGRDGAGGGGPGALRRPRRGAGHPGGGAGPAVRPVEPRPGPAPDGDATGSACRSSSAWSSPTAAPSG